METDVLATSSDEWPEDWSKDGRYLMKFVSAVNRHELRLIDAKTLKHVRDISLPLGAGSARQRRPACR